MIRLFPLLLPLAAMSGCIIYDSAPGKCDGCRDDDAWDDTGRQDGDHQQADDPGADDSGDAAADHAFTLDPSEAALGETLIASLTVEGTFDLSTIEGVEFLGGVDVLATQTRDDEVLITLSVPADAQLGPQDLLLRLSDGQAEIVDGALTVTDGSTDGDGGTDANGNTGDGGSDGTSGGNGGTTGDTGGCG
jgi:hypothetical protein